MEVRLNILGILFEREKFINTKFKRPRISREKIKKSLLLFYKN